VAKHDPKRGVLAGAAMKGAPHDNYGSRTHHGGVGRRSLRLRDIAATDAHCRNAID